MSIQVIVQLSAKEDKQDSFRKLMASAKKDLPTVNGCQSVNIYHKTSNPLEATLVETWESTEHHHQFLDNAVKSGARDTLKEHLQEEPISNYYQKM
ncbi:antibiotic biosynthesis monooxygenase family protein [Gilvimarinus sp. SDUM040013]|uniref:Antibiotic biosynthesis monooxygenase family protein n=1 Tax=Gilvimarinus gilvus TaxID=3058038 RepID=A0ABU4S1U2_9GAMM|nr:antibiotic biosynthesis monooxygenase family protein [Gilvimarinus sp. SDUM040013]MDO3385468.1 antibiotic biosynthesis monooxygenase family protein [Gilvimarinus sp. SDUM040013]MDX6851115.1 antibiotic biosynthesis monooxygenase family protein [Gilvimarinus sp. SDUM040013]